MFYIILFFYILTYIVIVILSKNLVFEPFLKLFIKDSIIKPITSIFTIIIQIALFMIISSFISITNIYHIKELIYGMLLGMTLILISIFILKVSGVLTIQKNAPITVLKIVSITMFFIVTVLFEELLFRGILYQGLRTNLRFSVTIIISIVIFTIPHLFNRGITVMSVISILLGGYVLSMLIELSGSVLLPIGFHFGWNYTQGILGMDVSGNRIDQSFMKAKLKGPNLITGGDFGIEASLIPVVLLLLFAITLTFIKFQH